MDDIYYIPAVAACAVVAWVLWWAIGRYRQSWLKSVLAAVGGVVLGYAIYFVVTIILLIVVGAMHADRPDLARETGAALGYGFKIIPRMLMFVAIAVLILRGRFGRRIGKKEPPANSNGATNG